MEVSGVVSRTVQRLTPARNVTAHLLRFKDLDDYSVPLGLEAAVALSTQVAAHREHHGEPGRTGLADDIDAPSMSGDDRGDNRQS